MYFKINIKLLIKIICVVNLAKGLLVTPTPPQVIVPKFENCTQFSNNEDNWVKFNYNGKDSRNCYLYPTYRTHTANWHEANDDCLSKNATLLSIHDFPTNYILSHPTNAGLYTSDIMWLGLNSLNHKRGEYQWSDGSPREINLFVNITSSGDPVSSDVREQGRCVSMRVTHSGRIFSSTAAGFWYKDDCNLNNYYICQKNTTTAPHPPPLPQGGCPTGWYNANQKCIKYWATTMSFEQARSTCEQFNQGEMMTIHSQEEQDFVTAMTAGLGTPYIGIKNKDFFRGWLWTDESRVSYTNWGIGGFQWDYDLNCAVVVTNSSQPGKWIKTNCTEKHSFLCQTYLDSSQKSGTNFLAQKCNITGFANFIHYRNSCYSVLDSDQQQFSNFQNAEKTCQSMGGSHLVSIVDTFEESFLKYLLSQNGKTANYWIGLQSKLNADKNVAQMFEWTDDWPVYYTNWAQNEPLFAGIPKDECVVMSKTNGTWRTTTCDSSLGFICKTTTNSLPKMSADKSGTCPQLRNITDKSLMWVDLDKRSQYCYWFSVVKKSVLSAGLESWSDASFHCHRRNGTLVSIHSNHELMLLSNKLSQTGSDYNTWIGLSKNMEGDFVWEDGSALDFTNWDPNEKIVSKVGNFSQNSDPQCVEVKSTDNMWKLQTCSGFKRNYYICSAKKIYPKATPSPTIQTTVGSTAKNTGPTTKHSMGKTGKHTPKVSTTIAPKVGKQENNSKSDEGLSGLSKAGISFGAVLGLIAVLTIGYFVFKRLRPNSPIINSFENILYSSRRDYNRNREQNSAQQTVTYSRD